MTGLTRRQRACLETLKLFQQEHGVMPTVEELRRLLGLTSKSAASRLLLRMEERGAIRRVHGCARAITIRRPACPHCGHELRQKSERPR